MGVVVLKSISILSQASAHKRFLCYSSLGDCRARQVLDLGSGPGNVAEVFAQRRADVTGVDFSPQMVKVAPSRYRHISFEEANGEQLPFEDAHLMRLFATMWYITLLDLKLFLRKYFESSSPEAVWYLPFGALLKIKPVLGNFSEQ
jgi:trans-aconitate methyltransferase